MEPELAPVVEPLQRALRNLSSMTGLARLGLEDEEAAAHRNFVAAWRARRTQLALDL